MQQYVVHDNKKHNEFNAYYKIWGNYGGLSNNN